jgi:ATP-dependent protease ClpP protease subunit
MSDQPSGGKPAAVQSIGGRPAPGATPPRTSPAAPKGVVGKVQSRERPAALPVPADRSVSALVKPSVLDKWSDDAAGIRALEPGDNVVTMFDVIGEDWWTGGGVTAKKVAAQLRAIGSRPVEVQINSPGGDMFEGLAIYNVLREHPQPVTVKVMGMAASAASIIAMAGDTLEIGAASFLMIHKCWVTAQGNEDDMREVADFLAPFDRAMSEVYAQRSGKTAAECLAWMKAETYMSGADAIERGFADALLPADQTTRDSSTKASDRERGAVTALELKLLAGGDTRAQAREHISKIKGKPDAAQDDASKPDAGGNDPELMSAMQALLDDFRK